jgi:hypothetical protein
MSSIKELLIEMQEMYSTVDLTEMLYPTMPIEDEPVNQEKYESKEMDVLPS